MRFIDGLMFSNSMGVLTIILQQIIVRDLRQWLALASIFSVAFAVAFMILMPHANYSEVRSVARVVSMPSMSLVRTPPHAN